MAGKVPFLERLSIEPQVIPLYVKMKGDKSPIFIWGCGNLASSINRYCKEFQIAIAGCFVNTGKTEKMFENMPVLSLDEIIAEYPRFSVIIGHAHYLEGTSFLKEIENVTTIYCIASCAYDMWNPVSADFLREHTVILNQLYENLQDELSKKCMISYFESRVNDRAEYIFPCTERTTGYYTNDIFTLTDDEVLLDVGAWNGAAIWPFIDAVKGGYRHIIALEPDEQNFGELKENIENRGIKNITAKMICAYDKDGVVKFEVDPTDGQMGGIHESAKNYKMCPAMKIDSLCRELGVTDDVSILKINFPFSVSNVLNGAADLLKNKRPKVIVRVGFEEHGLLETYIALKNINPAYKFYFRYTVEMPQGLTLFAI